MIELLRTSTDPQISKGVDALKQLFLKKRGIQFPLAVPAFKNACALNPPLWPGWNRHLVNSTAPPPPLPGQHVVKCVLNPRISHVKSLLSPTMLQGSRGRGINWLMHNSLYHTKPNPITVLLCTKIVYAFSINVKFPSSTHSYSSAVFLYKGMLSLTDILQITVAVNDQNSSASAPSAPLYQSFSTSYHWSFVFMTNVEAEDS